MRAVRAAKWVLPYIALMAIGCGDDNNNNDPPQRLKETLLVSDQPDAGATTTDPNLVNAWGLAFNPAGPIWVADNGTGLATVYTAEGQIVPLVVTIPTPPVVVATTPGAPTAPSHSAPTGAVFNSTNGFQGDKFIFSTEDGTIAGWQANNTATLRADKSASGTRYKGLAIAAQNNIPRIYATDFHNGKVDVYDGNYGLLTLTNGFTNPAIPAGFAPFGIRAIGEAIFVTYAKQDTDAQDDVAGAGNGFVAVFDFDGKLQTTLISNGLLNSPWGIAVAPSDFGNLSNELLIGNFGDGRINGYDLKSGSLVSTVQDTNGAPLVIDGLWSLLFGNDTAGAAHNQLFFTAGPNMESHGLLGRLDLAP
jgi:uncharacterized protein (TIGR03118 family)